MANDNPRARLAELRDRWDSDRSSRLFLQLAEEYRRLGQPQDALEVLSEGLKNHPATGAVQVVLGRCQLETGDHDAAVETLEQVVRRDPTQMVAYRALVEAYLQQRNAEKARERLGLYAQLNPQDPEIEELSQRIDRLDVALEPEPPSEVTPPEPAEEASNEVLPPAPEEAEDPPAPEGFEPHESFDPGATVQVPTPSLADLTPPSEAALESDEAAPLGVPEPPDLPDFPEPPEPSEAPESLADDLIARAAEEGPTSDAPADMPEPPSLPAIPQAEDLLPSAADEAVGTEAPSFDAAEAEPEEVPVATAPVPVSDLPDAPDLPGASDSSIDEGDAEPEEEAPELPPTPLSLPDAIAAQAASLSATGLSTEESAPEDDIESEDSELEAAEIAVAQDDEAEFENEPVRELATPHLDLSEPEVDDVEPATESEEEPEVVTEADEETFAAESPESEVVPPDSWLAAADDESEASSPVDGDDSPDLVASGAEETEPEVVESAEPADELSEAPELVPDEAVALEAGSEESEAEYEADVPVEEDTEVEDTEVEDTEVEDAEDEDTEDEDSEDEVSKDGDSESGKAGLAAAAGFVGSLGLGWVATREGEDPGEAEPAAAASEETLAQPSAVAPLMTSAEAELEPEDEPEAEEPVAADLEEEIQLAEPTNGVVFQLDASRLPPLANLELIPPRPLRRPRGLQAPAAVPLAPMATAPEPLAELESSEPEEPLEEVALETESDPAESVQEPAAEEPPSDPETVDSEESGEDWSAAAGVAAAAGTATLANLYRDQGHTEEAARVMSTLREPEPETAPELTAADLLEDGADNAGLSVRKSAMLKNYLDRLKGESDVS